MNVSSWGNYPRNNDTVLTFKSIEELSKIIKKNNRIIAFGNGRSYGDSSLSEKIISFKSYNKILAFNVDSGILHVQSGVLLSDIIQKYVSLKWFLKITPGTKYITFGGAIASDVHGKNHHHQGCFSESIKMFRLMLPNGEIVTCSNRKNPELFKASCGGMGLTGLILDVKVQLVKIKSTAIDQTTIKAKNLRELFDLFEKYHSAPYSVAWIDSSSKSHSTGRGLLKLGTFCDDENFTQNNKSPISVPKWFPPIFINSYCLRVLNLYNYHRQLKKYINKKTSIEHYFFPLDRVNKWNNLYGTEGFLQYQFALPKKESYVGILDILNEVTKSSVRSFLTTLKLLGPENDNHLSFPTEGYTLAMDFKMSDETINLLDKLDKIVLKYNGKIYLTKDARISKEVFEKGYSKIDIFRKLRKEFSMDSKFQSHQSKRLGL